MPNIDPSSRAAGFIRPENVEPKKTLAHPTAQNKASNLEKGPTKHGNSLLDSLAFLEPRLQQQLLQRVRALSREDARQARKVFQLFMESVFMQKFSADTSANVDWKTLTNPVIDQMEEDQELLAAINEAAQHLVQAAARPDA